jgi:hypothetical protein
MFLAWRLAGRTVGEQIVHGERRRMRDVGVERMHQRRSFKNDPNPGMTMTVDPPLVTLGQAKPTLQIEVVSDRFKHALADEQAGEKARHHAGHLPLSRVLRTPESSDQFLEPLLPLRAGPFTRFEGRGDFL